MFARFMRTDNRNGEGECYQVNGRIEAAYNDATHKLNSLTFSGQPIVDDKFYTIGLIGYHIINSQPYFGVTQKELLADGKSIFSRCSAGCRYVTNTLNWSNILSRWASYSALL